ncbi:MAG: Glu-tRNA(Gln) amidotransferase GatDE subunit D, partial [Thermoprotei archaeon]
MGSLEGYGDAAAKVLQSGGVRVFDIIEVERDDGVVIRGVLLPRPHYGDPDVLVLKLPNGYNIGVDARRVRRLRKVGRVEPGRAAPSAPPSLKPGLPRIH